MASPEVEAVGHCQARQQQDPDLGLHLAKGDGPGGNRPIGLVDRVDLAVVVVVDRLGVASQQGAAHHHAGEGGGHFGQGPVETARSGGTTEHPPDEGNPGDRLHQLEPDLPDGGGAAGTLHAEQLAGSTAGTLVPRLGWGGAGLAWAIAHGLTGLRRG